jgi:hypothetical protein
VKVPHQPADLEARLQDLGGDVTVKAGSGPFYWGADTAAAMCPYGRLEGHRVGSFGGSGAVDVSTVVDIEYVDGVVGVLDAISDAVLTAVDPDQR